MTTLTSVFLSKLYNEDEEHIILIPIDVEFIRKLWKIFMLASSLTELNEDFETVSFFHQSCYLISDKIPDSDNVFYPEMHVDNLDNINISIVSNGMHGTVYFECVMGDVPMYSIAFDVKRLAKEYANYLSNGKVAVIPLIEYNISSYYQWASARESLLKFED